MIAGIKFIPLRTPGGELIPGSGLFMQIKKTAVATNTADMSSGRGKINRQDAIDLQDVGDHAKEEREKCAGERPRTDSVERDQKRQQLINSQAEESLGTSAADLSLINNPQQTRNTWRHKLT